MATTAKEFIEKATTSDYMSLDEVRKMARINIILPANTQSDDKLDSYEFPTINGKTTQIKLGEPVAVDWITFKAIIDSGRYTPNQILA